MILICYFQDKSHKESKPCSIYKSHVLSLNKKNITINSWNKIPDENIQHILNLHQVEKNQVLNITYDVFKVTSDVIRERLNKINLIAI